MFWRYILSIVLVTVLFGMSATDVSAVTSSPTIYYNVNGQRAQLIDFYIDTQSGRFVATNKDTRQIYVFEGIYFFDTPNTNVQIAFDPVEGALIRRYKNDQFPVNLEFTNSAFSTLFTQAGFEYIDLGDGSGARTRIKFTTKLGGTEYEPTDKRTITGSNGVTTVFQVQNNESFVAEKIPDRHTLITPPGEVPLDYEKVYSSPDFPDDDIFGDSDGISGGSGIPVDSPIDDPACTPDQVDDPFCGTANNSTVGGSADQNPVGGSADTNSVGGSADSGQVGGSADGGGGGVFPDPDEGSGQSGVFPNTDQGEQTTGGGGGSRFGIRNPLKVDSFTDLLNLVFQNIILPLGTTIVVFFIVYSGFLFVVAQGNEEKLKTAKRTLLWTVIGAAVLLGASVIANVISNTIDQLS